MRSVAILATSAVFVSVCAMACTTETAPVGASTSSLSEGDKIAFCPKKPVTRRDMARYLERMKNGRDYAPPAARGVFDDVRRGSDDEPWIEQLYSDGITNGCVPGVSFCPNDAVPREQMAAFIMRLRHGRDFSRASSSRFVDVTGDSQQFAGYIEQLADDGITTGCDPTHFCPKDIVNREQMAAFLMRAVHPGADPGGRGTFADVAGDSQFMGRIEQAVSEGIMEPCDAALDAFTDGAPRGNVAVVALRPTDRQGIVNAPVTKYYGNASLEDDCGGSYYVHVAADVGRIGPDTIEVKNVTYFYVGNRYALGASGWLDASSNATGNVRSTNGLVRLDDNGTPFQTFEVNTTFSNVRAPSSGLVLQHWVQPQAPYIPGLDGAAFCGMSVKTLLQVVD